MEQTFLKAIKIEKVRHLKNIIIPLNESMRKHLILTGRNGSGKTSVIEALVRHFEYVLGDFYTRDQIEEMIVLNKRKLSNGSEDKVRVNQSLNLWENLLLHWTEGAITDCTSFSDLREKYAEGRFVLAYYKADRFTKVETSKSIEKVELSQQYKLNDSPGAKLVKYMVDLKATQAFAQQKMDNIRVSEIENWFLRFEGILKKIFDDPSLRLDFDIDNFTFRIIQTNRDPFDFNTMSSGYSAVFMIINDLIMRMEKHKTTDMEGIALIDEIDTHLHLELQRTILPFLTELFPNIQFIVTTHSPFILNSIENAVIFDLETRTLVENGLKNYPYDGIVESYFNTDHLSAELRDKLNRYKVLAEKSELTDRDWAEIAELECTLDEIPDFLSPKIAEEYNRLQLELSNRR